MSDRDQTTERVVFSEEAKRSHVKLVACGEIDGSLLDGLSAFIARQRQRRKLECVDGDGDWAE